MSSTVERFSHRERRFLATSAQAAAVLADAARQLHVAVYDPDRPVAYARTLYLAGDGLPPGTRLRIRQYGAAASHDQPAHVTSSYLEYKRPDGEHRDKVRVAAPARALADLLGGRMVDDWHARLQAIPELRDVVSDLVRGALAPRLLTWYRRVSLAGTGMRMTLDEEVAFAPPEPLVDEGGLAAPAGVHTRLPGVIIEIKSSDDLPPWLAERLRGLPGAPHSKFEVGLAALDGQRPGATGQRHVA